MINFSPLKSVDTFEDSPEPGGSHPDNLPCHVAIVMDGNGRWAKQRHLPRFAGHRASVDTVKDIIQACGEKGINVLTLFAFSSENWRRPKEEVGMLMGLFMTTLEQQTNKLNEHNIRLQIIGERGAFDNVLRERIVEAEALTRTNTGLKLVIAVNYGGRWDMTRACREIATRVRDGELDPESITPEVIDKYLSLSELPAPDLFIRTGGEIRVSNFLIWHLAYAELYFTDTLWPDFNRQSLDAALNAYASRQRRFGQTSEQVDQIRAR